MEEYNLEEIWIGETFSKKIHLSLLPGKVIDRKSLFPELRRIKNLFWWHMFIDIVFTSALIIGYTLYGIEEISFLEILFTIIYMGVIYYFGISYFIAFVKGINKNMTIDVKMRLNNYLKTLKQYRKNLFRLALIILGFSGIEELIDSLLNAQFTFLFLIGTIVRILFTFGIAYVIIEAYYDYMYSGGEVELENLIRELE